MDSTLLTEGLSASSCADAGSVMQLANAAKCHWYTCAVVSDCIKRVLLLRLTRHVKHCTGPMTGITTQHEQCSVKGFAESDA